MKRPRIKQWMLVSLMTAMVLLAAPGCSRNKAQEEQNAEYRAMLERSRARNATEQARLEIYRAIQKFQSDLGRLPKTLPELVSVGYLKKLPPPPENMGYLYDPVLGRIQVAPRRKP